MKSVPYRRPGEDPHPTPRYGYRTTWTSGTSAVDSRRNNHHKYACAPCLADHLTPSDAHYVYTGTSIQSTLIKYRSMCCPYLYEYSMNEDYVTPHVLIMFPIISWLIRVMMDPHHTPRAVLHIPSRFVAS